MSAAAMVLVLHCAVIALVMFSRTMMHAATAPGLISFDIPAGSARVPQPLSPAPVHVIKPPIEVPAPVLQIARVDLMETMPEAMPIGDVSAQIQPATIGGSCDLTPQVQDALRHSDAISGQLPAIPAARRSIANAVVVWNAGWIDAGTGPAQAAFSAIRQTIEQSVAGSSADCRNQLQAGPRLIYLPDKSGKTTVLALGSGQWSWQQLIAGAVQMPTDPARVASARVSGANTSDHDTPALNALLASLIGPRASAATPHYP